MCTINESHMMYGSWDMECNGQNFLSFWTVFCPFTSLTTQKIKILKRMEKLPRNITILHRCNINDNHMMYGSWDTECVGQNFLPFWTIFCTFTPPNNLKNQTFEKNEKPPGDITLHKCTINDSHMMYGSWDV